MPKQAMGSEKLNALPFDSTSCYSFRFGTPSVRYKSLKVCIEEEQTCR